MGRPATARSKPVPAIPATRLSHNAHKHPLDPLLDPHTHTPLTHYLALTRTPLTHYLAFTHTLDPILGPHTRTPLTHYLALTHTPLTHYLTPHTDRPSSSR